MKAGRPLWWAAGLSLCLLALAAIVFVLVQDRRAQRRGHAHPRAGSQRTRRTGIEGSGGAGSGGQLGARVGRGEAVSTATANARALRVRDFTLRYVDEDAGALSAGSDAWVGAVDTTWAFRGFDRTVASDRGVVHVPPGRRPGEHRRHRRQRATHAAVAGRPRDRAPRPGRAGRRGRRGWVCGTLLRARQPGGDRCAPGRTCLARRPGRRGAGVRRPAGRGARRRTRRVRQHRCRDDHRQRVRGGGVRPCTSS